MVSEENKDNQMNKDSKRPTIKKSENETTKPFSPKKIEEEKAIHRTNEQTIIRRRKSPDNKVKPKILSNAASEETLEENGEKEPVSKRRQAKQAKKEAKKEKKLSKGRIRYIPVWLRVILIALLCIGAFIGGLMVGFGTLGEGDDMKTVLDREFWDSIFNYIRGE